jgi:hypothetical protein
LHFPDTGWTHGSWNGKRKQFDLLGRMIGLTDRPSPEELQDALKRVASAKVFAESVAEFLAATPEQMSREDVAFQLEQINNKLGAMEPVPFRSMLHGQVDPTTFDGVAILPAGTVSWMQLRWDQIKLHQQARARFEHIIVLGSSRVCNAAADRKHPFIRENFAEGEEPTERQLLKLWINGTSGLNPQYTFPELPQTVGDEKWLSVMQPDPERDGKPLSLEEQLMYLDGAGQLDELRGSFSREVAGLQNRKPIYVPANQNALYVPLHVKSVLRLPDIWFSQSGARTEREPTPWWSPMIQDLWTTPSGILRLWIELVDAGCLTN